MNTLLNKNNMPLIENRLIKDLDISINVYDNSINYCQQKMKQLEYKKNLKEQLPIIYEIIE